MSRLVPVSEDSAGLFLRRQKAPQEAHTQGCHWL